MYFQVHLENPVTVGNLFNSFAELEAKKEYYQKLYFCQLNTKDARTLEGAHKRVPNRVSVVNQQLESIIP